MKFTPKLEKHLRYFPKLPQATVVNETQSIQASSSFRFHYKKALIQVLRQKEYLKLLLNRSAQNQSL